MEHGEIDHLDESVSLYTLKVYYPTPPCREVNRYSGDIRVVSFKFAISRDMNTNIFIIKQISLYSTII